MARILLTNATIVTGASSKKGALAIDGERIAGIWHRGGSDLDDSAAVQAFPDSEIIDLDVPSLRFTNMIGTSASSNPSFQAVYFISIWNP